MNITFPKITDREANLCDKLLSSKSLSVYYLARVDEFEDKELKDTDEKIAQFMYLIEDSCKHVTTFCRLSRQFYQLNLKKDQPGRLIDLIGTIKNFIDEYWSTTRDTLEWIDMDLFPDGCFPFKFTETEEILKETKKLVKNRIIENLRENLPALFENFKKIFQSLREEEIDLNFKEYVFTKLKVANADLKKSITTSELFSILNMVNDAFPLCLLKNKAISNNPLKSPIATTLAFLKFPSIFSYTYKINLEKLLKRNFIKFNSIAIYGNGTRDSLSPIFFQALLTTLSKLKDKKKYHITLTNLGLTDANLMNIIKAAINLNIDTFNLTGNLITGKNLSVVMSLIRCDTWILINNPVKEIELLKE